MCDGSECGSESSLVHNALQLQVICSTNSHNHGISKDSVSKTLKDAGAVYVTDSGGRKKMASQVPHHQSLLRHSSSFLPSCPHR